MTLQKIHLAICQNANTFCPEGASSQPENSGYKTAPCGHFMSVGMNLKTVRIPRMRFTMQSYKMKEQQVPMSLDISYDLVCCIDCLSDEEQAKYKISQELIEFLASIGIKNLSLICPDKKAFIEACSYLKEKAKKSVKFCIHIISHGNKNGIGIKATGEPILWKELGDMLGVINNEMNNGLILNFTSCMGLHGIKITEHIKMPFFGLVGYSEKIENHKR